MKQSYYVDVLVIRPNQGDHEILMARRSEDKYMGGHLATDFRWVGARRNGLAGRPARTSRGNRIGAG
ncbi:hypothetical protein Mal52_59710 [Symmachiella dynata]|uniref:Uncharacterized protein n=1 Tax=Symmachiella dynata TaxID=2527995 RepID=A0A517ZY87_9PLAN|nr:hypothetical protein Mal52_59710 [Symmachiella dynata]